MDKPSIITDITKSEVKYLLQDQKIQEAYELMVEPLHEALYESQSFDLLDKLSVEERVALAFDYIRTQVGAGGFIQLIQNGYVSLILIVIEGLQELNTAAGMATILDDVLKVYVLNVDMLSKETSVDEFAKLYNEFKEFDILEERFEASKVATMEAIINHCINVRK